MPTAQRRTEPGVIQQLLDEPQRFQFFQAVRLLELWLYQNGVPLERALTDYLRFRNSLSLSFPTSEIERLALESGSDIVGAAQFVAALLDERPDAIAITPAFMGLLGVGGVLPNHYTERLSLAQHHGQGAGARAFLDIYTTRALALFYQASAQYRIEYRRDAHGEDGYRPLLWLLAGGDSFHAAPTDPGMARQAVAYYSALIRQRTATSATMTAVLSEYFGVPFEILQFDGFWEHIPQSERQSLGGKNAMVLARGAILGPRCWTRDQRVRIRIGPLNKADFNRFVPGADRAQALQHLLSSFPCAPLRFRVQLILRKEYVHSVTLGPPQSGKLGLGRDTFLMTKPATEDNDSFQYDLRLW